MTITLQLITKYFWKTIESITETVVKGEHNILDECLGMKGLDTEAFADIASRSRIFFGLGLFQPYGSGPTQIKEPYYSNKRLRVLLCLH